MKEMLKGYKIMLKKEILFKEGMIFIFKYFEICYREEGVDLFFMFFVN